MDLAISRHASNSRMSKAVTWGGLVFLSGQTSSGTEATSIEEQTTEVLRRIEMYLAETGSSKDRLLSATIYLKSMKDFAAMNQVWESWIPPGGAPARTTVEANMASERLLVEITTIATRG